MIFKKILVLTLFFSCSGLFSLNNQKIIKGQWVSLGLKSKFNFKDNNVLEITNSQNSEHNYKIFGFWRITEKYLYLKYISIMQNGKSKEYYKLMLFQIKQITNSRIRLKNFYTLKEIVLQR